MSTLSLQPKAEKPAPLIPGCRVTLEDLHTIEWALRRLKKLCGTAGRGNAKGRKWRELPETRGQKARRKLKAAIGRRTRAGKGRAHRDP